MDNLKAQVEFSPKLSEISVSASLCFHQSSKFKKSDLHKTFTYEVPRTATEREVR